MGNKSRQYECIDTGLSLFIIDYDLLGLLGHPPLSSILFKGFHICETVQRTIILKIVRFINEFMEAMRRRAATDARKYPVTGPLCRDWISSVVPNVPNFI